MPARKTKALDISSISKEEVALGSADPVTTALSHRIKREKTAGTSKCKTFPHDLLTCSKFIFHMARSCLVIVLLTGWKKEAGIGVLTSIPLE